MNEFNFKAVNAAPRASSGTLGSDSGDTLTLLINSYKTKYINGNAGGKTNVNFDDPSNAVPSWLQISHVWSSANEAYRVTFKALETNTEAARSYTATFTQWESEKTISYTITQDVSKTYEFDTNKFNILFEGSGSSSTVKVTSRIVPGFEPYNYFVQGVPDWITVSKGDWVDGVQELTLTASRNPTNSQRTATIVLEQITSVQKTINLYVTQGLDYTYTYFLKVLNISATIGNGIGDTTSIFVQSYMIRSDGEVMAKEPNIGATPSWANNVTIKSATNQGANWYEIVVKATAANISSSQRSGTLLITCGDKSKEVTIYQQATEQDITLTLKWPSGTDSGALFLFPESPQQGSTSVTYFSMIILDDKSTHVYKKSVGIRVNKNDGQTVQALPGQSINCFRWINGGWAYAGYFVLPESDVTITL